MHALKVLSAAIVLALMPFEAGAGPFDYDASAQLGSISFSEGQLYAGEQVRIYGMLINLGDKDIRGTVRFYQGAIGLGEPQFFSLKAHSASEDFWVDWRPSEGTYNISMSIENTDPVDQNPGNNTAVTGMLTITKRPPPPPPVVQPVRQPTQGAPNAQTTSKKAPGISVDRVHDANTRKQTIPLPRKLNQEEPKQGQEGASLSLTPREVSEIAKEIVTRYADEATSDTVDTSKPVPFAPSYPPVMEQKAGVDNGKKLIFLLTGFAGLSLVFGGVFWALSKREE